MDALCFQAAGIQAMVPPPPSTTDRPSLPPIKHRNLPWGFTFRRNLGSLWPSPKPRLLQPPPLALLHDDSVMLDHHKDSVLDPQEEDESSPRYHNWVLKILHIKSLWKQQEQQQQQQDKEEEEKGPDLADQIIIPNLDDQIENATGDETYVCDGCDGCPALDDDDRQQFHQFDRDSFSKLLKKVPLAEARLYAKMSYLGNLAYAIPDIKPESLLRNHGLQMVTSSVEKRGQLEKEKATSEEDSNTSDETEAVAVTSEREGEGDKADTPAGNHISASAAYHIVASAASYLHSHTRTIFRSKSSNSMEDQHHRDENNEDVVSLMATTDSVTAVVAAKEEVKQAVADDLNSTLSSPCEWFACDDNQNATRLFVIKGSETLASWKANLLFEPIKFEGLDVLVHRGIYEAAKGIYEQMLPEVRAHLQLHGERATFRFTGHSLGGSLSLLVSLMLLIRGEAPRSSLLPVVTFGAPSIMCGGDQLLCKLGLPKSHVRSITMHRDIVPRAFSCHYPGHVAEFLKAINGNFRNLPCLSKQNLLYAPMGEFLILQPDDKFSPNHELLPPGSGLYVMTCPDYDIVKGEKQIQAAQAVFLSSPHPLEILSDRSAYGSGGTIQRDHDMNSYLKSVRNVIRHDLSRIRKVKRERQRKVWWPLVAPNGVNAGIIFSRPVIPENMMVQGQLDFSGMVQTGRDSLKRFTRLIASQHMHLLVVLLFPARLLVLGAFNLIKIH